MGEISITDALERYNNRRNFEGCVFACYEADPVESPLIEDKAYREEVKELEEMGVAPV